MGYSDATKRTPPLAQFKLLRQYKHVRAALAQNDERHEGTFISPSRFCAGEHYMPSLALNGLRILVVEDEPVIALHIAQTLTEAGAEVIGPAANTARALHLMDRSRVDAAVIDYRLEGETASLLAHQLAAMRVPFLFHTSSGNNPGLMHPGVPIVNKPSRPEQLVMAVCDLTRRTERSG